MKNEYSISEQELVTFKKRRYVRMLADSAIRSGKLSRPSICALCDEEKAQIEAHHVDYGKPYDVIWLCTECHGKAHRKNHPLNPANNNQTSMPEILEKYNQVTVTFTVPVKNFLAMKSECERSGKTISKIMRDDFLKKYPILNNQLEFNFKELENDQAQNVQLKRIQRLAKDEAVLPESQRGIIQPVRSTWSDDMFGMERGLFSIFEGHGGDAGIMQRAVAN
jgi:protein-arginine kinase activator protein McsA